MNEVSEKLNIFKCPSCESDEIAILDEQCLQCVGCKRQYPYKDNMVQMISSFSDENISKFWDADLERRFKGVDISRDVFYEMCASFEEALKDKEHLLTVEICLAELEGKKVLEIGSGSGAHSALMKKYGADVVAMDISAKRVEAAADKLAFVTEGSGIAMQGDATILPFRDNQFDIVYSNGVLHHSANTGKSLKEIYRVLKPGGRAAIMLYARHSVATYLYRYPKGIASGLFFKYPEEQWMGHVTEGGPCGEIANPYTRVYSRKQLNELFSDYSNVTIRQSSFSLKDIPRVGKYIYEYIRKVRNLKDFEGTVLTSGIPMPQLAPIEKKYGKYIGNCMNILAFKD